MPKHLDSLYKPEPADTPTTTLRVTELEMQHIRLHISPNHTLCGYATGRSLDAKLAAGLLDLHSIEDLESIRADIRRVLRADQIASGQHDGAMPAD